MLRSLKTIAPLLALSLAASAAPAGESRLWKADALELRKQVEAGTVRVPLPDGRSLTLLESKRSTSLAGSSCWSGDVVGEVGGDLAQHPGHLALVLYEDAVAGTLRTPDAAYSIRSDEHGGLWTETIASSTFAGCGTGLAHEVSSTETVDGASRGSGAGRGVGGPSGSSLGPAAQVGPAIQRPEDTVVDVIVVWTPAAQAIVGGPAAVQALADLSVLETNLAYDRSGVALEMRTVHTTLVDYGESASMQTDLARLRDKNDGFLDEIHPLRDAFGADGVSMLVSGTNPCGVGYLMAVQPSLTFERSAFNVASYSCAASNLTLAHEFGHNFGLSHDRANTPNTPSQPYAFGYRTTNGAWRTIMAIFNGTRIGYFSTPARSFMGFVLGIDPSEPDGAANAFALNANAPFLSAWRPTVVPDTAVTTKPDPFPREVAGHRGVLLENTGANAPQALVFGDGDLRWLAPWRPGERSRWIPLADARPALGVFVAGGAPRFLAVR